MLLKTPPPVLYLFLLLLLRAAHTPVAVVAAAAAHRTGFSSTLGAARRRVAARMPSPPMPTPRQLLVQQAITRLMACRCTADTLLDALQIHCRYTSDTVDTL